MKSRFFGIYAVGICAIGALLAGCSTSSEPVPVANALSKHPDTSSFRVLHSFGNGKDGASPQAELIDVNGTLYGTTELGGKFGKGTVFSITTAGKEKVLHSFGGRGSDYYSGYPMASLLDVKGTLYGTTTSDGEGGSSVGGTVYALSTSGAFRGLWFFPQGSEVTQGLIAIGTTLYGVTGQGGGSSNGGTMFSLTTASSIEKYKLLYSFGPDSGEVPNKLMEENGLFYGTTQQGGQYFGAGIAYQINPDGTGEITEHNFGGGSGSNFDGVDPKGSLTYVPATGLWYGVTSSGGKCCQSGYADNCGIVFSVGNGSNAPYQVLHYFGKGKDGCTPGAQLYYTNGLLYGTTWKGGEYGLGTVFSVTTGGQEKVLHSFNGSDGESPASALLPVNGTLYGTTFGGGKGGGEGGTVFALTP